MIKQGNGSGKVPSVLCMLPITIIMIVSVLLCASPSVCSFHLLSLLLQLGKSKDLDKPKSWVVSCLWQQPPIFHSGFAGILWCLTMVYICCSNASDGNSNNSGSLILQSMLQEPLL